MNLIYRLIGLTPLIAILAIILGMAVVALVDAIPRDR